MDKIAITAISNISQEGFIATSLHRLGWKLIHRATSLDGLQKALEANPESLLITSTDFRGVQELAPIRLIKLDGMVEISQDQFHELIQNIASPQNEPRSRIKTTGAAMTVVASVGRSVGASTLALNIAQELANQNLSTVLIDGNRDHPYLSSQLSLHGIDREFLRTPFGFAACEVTPHQNLGNFGTSCDSYQHLVMDFGQLIPNEKLLLGLRMNDLLFTWAHHSDGSLLLVSKSDMRSLNELRSTIQRLHDLALRMRTTVLVIPQTVIGNRERSRIQSQLSGDINLEVKVLSHDRRAVVSMEERNTTLSNSAPKSVLRSEIVQLVVQELSGRKELPR